jgi:hypothetical protein
MKIKTGNTEMHYTQAKLLLSRRLGCGYFLVQTANLAHERRNQRFLQMRKRNPLSPFLALAVAAVIAFSTASWAQSAPSTIQNQEVAPAGDELTWPREFQDGGATVDIYQPQIEKWQGVDFETRSAVAITPVGSNAPVYGVFWMKARADVDKAARIVTLNDIQVTKAKFPSVPERQNEYLALIRKHVPAVSKTVALDHVEASYAVSEAVKKARTVAVKNDPPRIISTTSPALLVLVDGSPALRPMPNLEVERVINSRALILKDGSVFYLYASDHWYQAPDVSGPWKLATSTPASLEAAKQSAVASQSVDLMPPGTNAVVTTPGIFVSTVPAELIQTEGAPALLPIEGTELLQVQNTDNALFFDDGTQRYYVLLSGRWFNASSLKGPWAFVPYKNLPKDFAKISPTHPKANVLVSVPGTPQANEAVIANSIPQTATVQRNAAKLDVTYDGAPQFNPIAGTPLFYAINTTTPIIEVDAHTYYSVENGVWFVATSPVGSWSVATSVPSVIYSIPASSPLHYVTYARVYGSTPDMVYVGYTPGYLGTEVCPDHVVVYGTGWNYPPYIGSYWVGEPYTYGFGVGFADNWGIGFGFGFGAGEWLGTWCRPWWGPFGWGRRHHFDYDHVSLNHVDIYHHWRPGIVHAEHNSGFNAWNSREWSKNWSSHFNPYSSHAFDRTGVEHYGAYHGNFHAHIPGAPLAPHAPDSHNLYAGKDGSVYRYNPSGSWDRNTGSVWRHAPTAPQADLGQHAFGRSVGEQRFNNFGSPGGFGQLGGNGIPPGGHLGGNGIAPGGHLGGAGIAPGGHMGGGFGHFGGGGFGGGHGGGFGGGHGGGGHR